MNILTKLIGEWSKQQHRALDSKHSPSQSPSKGATFWKANVYDAMRAMVCELADHVEMVKVSEEDITKLRVIKRLVDELRLNLAGVEMAMAVFDHLSAARHEMIRRASAQAFDRMFNHIMELFEGSNRKQDPQGSEDR